VITNEGHHQKQATVMVAEILNDSDSLISKTQVRTHKRYFKINNRKSVQYYQRNQRHASSNIIDIDLNKSWFRKINRWSFELRSSWLKRIESTHKCFCGSLNLSIELSVFILPKVVNTFTVNPE
jgi:hypothetical protein